MEYLGSTAYGIRVGISEAIELERWLNEGYSEEYKRGWVDACLVLQTRLKALYEQEDPRTIG